MTEHTTKCTCASRDSPDTRTQACKLLQCVNMFKLVQSSYLRESQWPVVQLVTCSCIWSNSTHHLLSMALCYAQRHPCCRRSTQQLLRADYCNAMPVQASAACAVVDAQHHSAALAVHQHYTDMCTKPVLQEACLVIACCRYNGSHGGHVWSAAV